MTRVYLTVDTEYEAGFTARHGPESRADNFDRAIRGRTREQDVGIFYQMDRLEEYGLQGVFFVDPMPAVLWGTGAIADIVEPIVERGHDVQLHLHTEWLALAGEASPVGTRTGRNIKDFTLEDQCTLIDWAWRVLVEAGAPAPTAFRAGNYGANDDTLRALAELGFTLDSNHTPGIADSECEIELGPEDRLPLTRLGVIEVPIGCIGDPLQGQRHAQLTALSKRELMAAVRHARRTEQPGFTIVSHSFELLDRKRDKASPVLVRRFDSFCRQLAEMKGVATGTYRDQPPRAVASSIDASALPPSYLLAGERMAEQALANLGLDTRRWSRAALIAAGVAAAAGTMEI